ncbi:unnamed protein product [Moneuplotes crassus]|uniref:Uncharacterized protein n=1 Tax=Euplotes crassus TaxID=5936 RepID=A0AAD1U8T2_EUPCR|nr:unnamed protein product [Moneuplotes crassus]
MATNKQSNTVRDQIIQLQTDPDFREKFYIEEHEKDDNVICNICLSGKFQDINRVVICELCLAATHQNCYHNELYHSVPEGNWFCARCSQILKEIGKIPKAEIFEKKRCRFCLKYNGILIKNRKFGYFHIVCARWLSQITIKEDGEKFKVGYSKEICKNKQCYKCCEQGGLTQKCNKGYCAAHFHITCAIKAGYLKEIGKMICSYKDKVEYYPLFCKKHEREGRDKFKTRKLPKYSKPKKKKPRKSKKSIKEKSAKNENYKEVINENDQVDISSQSSCHKDNSNKIPLPKKPAESCTKHPSPVQAPSKPDSNAPSEAAPKEPHSEPTEEQIDTRNSQSLENSTVHSTNILNSDESKKCNNEEGYYDVVKTEGDPLKLTEFVCKQEDIDVKEEVTSIERAGKTCKIECKEEFFSDYNNFIKQENPQILFGGSIQISQERLYKTLNDPVVWESDQSNDDEMEVRCESLITNLKANEDKNYLLKSPFDSLLDIKKGTISEIKQLFFEKCKQEDLLDTELNCIKFRKTQSNNEELKLANMIDCESCLVTNLESLILPLIILPNGDTSESDPMSVPSSRLPRTFIYESEYEQHLNFLYS